MESILSNMPILHPTGKTVLVVTTRALTQKPFSAVANGKRRSQDTDARY